MRAPGAALGGSLGSVSAQRECMLGTFSHSLCVSCTSSISGTHGAPPHGHLNLEASKLDAGHPARLHLISGGPRELPRILFVSYGKDSSDLNNGGSYSRDVPVSTDSITCRNRPWGCASHAKMPVIRFGGTKANLQDLAPTCQRILRQCRKMHRLDPAERVNNDPP